MRLFVACELDASIRDRLAAAVSKASSDTDGVKWVARENMHITLKFLGEVAPDDVDGITEELGAALDGTSAFTLRVLGLGAFPPRGNPQVLWAGVADGRDELAALNHVVEKAMEKRGFEREKRRFSPHATIGRTRRNARPRGLRELIDREADTDFGSQDTTVITLMKSDLKPSGPVYTPVQTWNLGRN